MTEVPQFRVFLDDDYSFPSSPLNFPDGIPCHEFYALDSDNAIPENFVFLCSLSHLEYEEYLSIYNVFGLRTLLDEKDTSLWSPLVPLSAVKTVIDSNGNEVNLDIAKLSWTLSNHVSKLADKELKFSGQVAHIILMGLQQALFVDVESSESFNPLFFELAIHIIESLSLGNKTLKEYFLTGFPCEYLETAQKRLGLK